MILKGEKGMREVGNEWETRERERDEEERGNKVNDGGKEEGGGRGGGRRRKVTEVKNELQRGREKGKDGEERR